jgi:hypothetical protein
LDDRILGRGGVVLDTINMLKRLFVTSVDTIEGFVVVVDGAIGRARATERAESVPAPLFLYLDPSL